VRCLHISICWPWVLCCCFHRSKSVFGHSHDQLSTPIFTLVMFTLSLEFQKLPVNWHVMDYYPGKPLLKFKRLFLIYTTSEVQNHCTKEKLHDI
jgi:hypothetical protein